LSKERGADTIWTTHRNVPDHRKGQDRNGVACNKGSTYQEEILLLPYSRHAPGHQSKDDEEDCRRKKEGIKGTLGVDESNSATGG
jgi:hypothetical protein